MPEPQTTSMQLRSISDPRAYNPGRDIAWNFKQVITEAAGRMEHDVWAAATGVLKAGGATQEDLAFCCQAYIDYMSKILDDPAEDYNDVLKRTNWYNLNPAAQVVFMAYLGTVYGGFAFRGIRECTLDHDGPLNSVAELVKAGGHFLAAVSAGKQPADAAASTSKE